MPSLTSHRSTSLCKVLVVGESGTGKTGGLASLAKAGYNLRIVDLDNLLGVLANVLKDDAAALDRVKYITVTEKMKPINGRMVPTTATVWATVIKLMDKFKDPDGEFDYGAVTTWGPNDVLVIDTLSRLAKSAFNNILGLNGKLLTGATGFEYGRVLKQAQDLVDSFMEMIASESIGCNVVVNAHLAYQDEPGTQRGSMEEVIPQVGMPQSIGKALSPKIPTFFNSTLMTKRVNGKPRYLTMPTNNVNLKTPIPNGAKAEYPIETGLAEFFKAVRGTEPTK